MQKISSFFNQFMERYLSSTRQIQRIILFALIALVLVVGSFMGYYYYDRFYSAQEPVAEKSIAEAEQAVMDDPTNLATRLQLAETYLVYLRYDDALIQANQVFASDPSLTRAWLIMGIANANNGHPADAITPLTNYVDQYKDQEMAALDKALVTAAYYLGDSYLQLGQPLDAILPLEMTVNWSQTDADSMYKLGLAYSGTERFEDAIFMFHLATSFVPNFTEAYQGMAFAYQRFDDTSKVDYANGMIAFSQKDYQAALKLLLQSSQADAEFAPVFAGLGLTYEAMEDLQNALASFEKGYSLDPKNFTAERGVQRVTALLKP